VLLLNIKQSALEELVETLAKAVWSIEEELKTFEVELSKNIDTLAETFKSATMDTWLTLTAGLVIITTLLGLVALIAKRSFSH